MIFKKAEKRNPWTWVPTLYFAEGIPYVVVMTVSVIMYKRLGISNTDIALYTSWLYLPWVIKPLWSPIVDILNKKRIWIIITQAIIAVGLAGVAFTIPIPNFFQYSLAFFWLIAFHSATHDIAADGFYMLGLSQHDQTWFVGIRSTFYRFAFLAGQGPLVILAGELEKSSKGIPYSWMVSFFILAGLFAVFFLYHTAILPHPASDKKADKSLEIINKLSNYILFTLALLIFLPFYFLMILLTPITKFDPRSLIQKLPFSENPFSDIIIKFLIKDNFGNILAFVLFYRLGEAQLVKIASPFLLDPKVDGGLGLSTIQVGFVYGTVGAIALTLGGILGGFLAAKNGLKYWLWWMIIAINLPDLVYVFLSYTQTSSFFVINLMVAIEQFGYGFGFTAYMLYLIYISEGNNKTAHYAIATGIMALGMMIPGMFSGWLQETLGYKHFFIWVCLATIPIFIIANFIHLDPEFGKKAE